MKNTIEDLIYLNATGFKLGWLVNFGHHPKLEWERMVNTRATVVAVATRTPDNFSL